MLPLVLTLKLSFHNPTCPENSIHSVQEYKMLTCKAGLMSCCPCARHGTSSYKREVKPCPGFSAGMCTCPGDAKKNLPDGFTRILSAIQSCIWMTRFREITQNYAAPEVGNLRLKVSSGS